MASLLPAADKKGKRQRPPDVTVLEFEARRVDQNIEIDGVVRVNALDQPLIGMRIKLNMFSSGNKLMTEQKAVIAEQLLEEGDEVPFYLACRDHSRAVTIEVELRSKKRMYLRVENPGPYPIE
jgi:hypothetical protein